jgi:hypothetical protein
MSKTQIRRFNRKEINIFIETAKIWTGIYANDFFQKSNETINQNKKHMEEQSVYYLMKLEFEQKAAIFDPFK